MKYFHGSLYGVIAKSRNSLVVRSTTIMTTTSRLLCMFRTSLAA